MQNDACRFPKGRGTETLRLASFGLLNLVLISAASAAPWPEALIRLERRPANGGGAQVSTAIAVAPGLLASIIDKSADSDGYRAVMDSVTSPVKLLVRDSNSGFALFAASDNTEPAWPVVPLGNAPGELKPGISLTLQSAAPAPARLAGRDLLYNSTLLQSPWLRVNLPPGTWMHGTPLTMNGGTLAGLLAGGVPNVPESARILPAAAVQHFVKLWHDRQTLAHAELGIRLSQTDAIPRIVECYAAFPAERAGIHPGDVLLSIGATEVADAAAAAEACFYLRVDEPVKITVLRGTDTIELPVTPVSASAKKVETPGK